MYQFQQQQQAPPPQSPYTLSNPGSWFTGPNQSVGPHPFGDALKQYGLSHKGKNFEPFVRRGLVGAMLPAATSSLQFGTDSAALRSRSAWDALALLDPKNNQAKVDRFRKRATANSQEESRRIGLILAEMGLGSGAQAASQLAAVNSATGAGNNFAAQIESPEYLLQNQQAMQQIIDSASVHPYLQMAMQAVSGTPYSPPQPRSNPLTGLLQLAGTAGGLGWSPFGRAGAAAA